MWPVYVRNRPKKPSSVLSMGEKPGVNALGRSAGHAQTAEGKTAQGHGATRFRRGAAGLSAAMDGEGGTARISFAGRQEILEFPDFTGKTVPELPEGQVIQVIMDKRRIRGKRG
jgi:hypothetical protein